MNRDLPFWKVQSIGNDFVLVHGDDVRRSLDTREEDLGQVLKTLAVTTGAHRFGIGSDGLLMVDRLPSGLAMRMFNPDGTEDFCGNGLRCAAQHAHSIGWVANRFEIVHCGRKIPTELGENGAVKTVIGPASYRGRDVPTVVEELIDSRVWSGLDSFGKKLDLVGSALTTGSAHLVLAVNALPDDELFLRVSPELENDSRFPERVSVIWAKAVSPELIEIRIWERGVGETAGCGTGSSAAAAEAFRRNRSGGVIHVSNPGGQVRVEAPSWDGLLTVEGPAFEVFAGSLEMPDPSLTLESDFMASISTQ